MEEQKEGRQQQVTIGPLGGRGGAFIGLEWKPVCPSFLSPFLVCISSLSGFLCAWGVGLAVIQSAWSLILYPLLRQKPSRLVKLDFVTLGESSIVIDSQA